MHCSVFICLKLLFNKIILIISYHYLLDFVKYPVSLPKYIPPLEDIYFNINIINIYIKVFVF